MAVERRNISFEKLERNHPIPFELLLMADPSIELVTAYSKLSDLFVAMDNDIILGVIVLFPFTAETIEIKNIAVRTDSQGQGIGSFLINNAIRVASYDKKIKSIYIRTANSSIGQLYLYQKLGFEISGIEKDFFQANYKRPIFENGIQAKHMLTLMKQL